MARDAEGFTPTQAALMYVLRDGQWHARVELYVAMDEHCANSLRYHVRCMRKILAPQGLLLLYSFGPITAGVGLQLVRQLQSMSVG